MNKMITQKHPANFCIIIIFDSDVYESDDSNNQSHVLNYLVLHCQVSTSIQYLGNSNLRFQHM